jgi:protein-S-isoprenylcysteine O-methyltransferase Ste14
MRAVTIAFALFLIATLAIASASELVLNSAKLPNSPLSAGWLGVAAVALLVAGTALLFRAPAHAGLLISLSGLAQLALSRLEKGQSLVPWGVGTIVLVLLVSKLTSRRRVAAWRAAVHARIDEEIVDPTRLA